MITEYEINTPREGLVDVTDMAARAVRSSGVAEGLCLVYCPHTTAGITINENADPDVARDFLIGLGKAFPDRAEFRHAEGNSAAHLKASAVGSSATVIVSGGLLVLGTWQGIYLCEFDGPRRRRLFVKVLG
ncbi:MAG TPA: secondary thiamine-phosphate synthase enzyme YjbQ [Treponemataceae bacterium]|jgi:secondary thiamine-phosphate synthase enzyme|nr:secondary thiamine-phosphate synthase enzyme YjbQ [Treponemataceae bacterium]